MIPILNVFRDRAPAGALYVGRPSLLGNPVPIDQNIDRGEAVRLYEMYFKDRVRLDASFRSYLENLKAEPPTALL